MIFQAIIGLTKDGKTLFELPIYRVSEDEYYKSLNEHYQKRKIPHNDPLYEESLNQNLFKDFGGDWKYNEIIGYLRFYKDVDYFIYINCFYYQINKKRITKTRTKQFIPVDDTLCKITIKSSYDNRKIAEKITEMVDYCSTLPAVHKRYIDREIFDNMVNCIDWRVLLELDKKGNG